MFQQANSLLLDELIDHVAENRTDGVETLIGLADIRKANVVKENLLNNEDCNRFAELRASLHDAKAERNDLRGQEEVDHIGGIVFDEGADDAEGSEAQILKWPGFGCSIEERIEKERDMS